MLQAIFTTPASEGGYALHRIHNHLYRLAMCSTGAKTASEINEDNTPSWMRKNDILPPAVFQVPFNTQVLYQFYYDLLQKMKENLKTFKSKWDKIPQGQHNFIPFLPQKPWGMDIRETKEQALSRYEKEISVLSLALLNSKIGQSLKSNKKVSEMALTLEMYSQYWNLWNNDEKDRNKFLKAVKKVNSFYRRSLQQEVKWTCYLTEREGHVILPVTKEEDMFEMVDVKTRFMGNVNTYQIKSVKEDAVSIITDKEEMNEIFQKVYSVIGEDNCERNYGGKLEDRVIAVLKPGMFFFDGNKAKPWNYTAFKFDKQMKVDSLVIGVTPKDNASEEELFYEFRLNHLEYAKPFEIAVVDHDTMRHGHSLTGEVPYYLFFMRENNHRLREIRNGLATPYIS